MIESDPNGSLWFHEKSDEFPGQAFSLEVEEVLFHQKSPYQDVLVFKSKTYGRVMVLDGIINSTERDEFAYQEMISFLPLNSHKHPRHVLIVGGGDGGVARECAKHPLVETITLVEIDQMVIDVSKQHLPELAKGLTHPKVTVHVTDGLEFLKNNETKYDVIIADLNDPDGPAAELFTQKFYKYMKERLNEGGILCTQGECFWVDLVFISRMMDFCRDLFPSLAYAYNSVPTYTTGNIGYIMCSAEEGKLFKDPIHKFTEEEADNMGLRFYDEHTHRAAFALPRYVRKGLKL